MMNDVLTDDTKAIILLCGVFGKGHTEKPLSLAEYSLLVRWLMGANIRPADLLQKDVLVEASLITGIDKQRLESLVGRGVQLGFAVEEWQRNGIWVISRSDADYPARYKKHLKDKAPALLFGAGNRSLLSGGGLGIVGSRNVDKAGEVFTRQVAELCACHSMPVVSGGARGVDQLSMNAALEAGGVAIGILAENLLHKSLERTSRKAIAEERLLLLSPYPPETRFSVEGAMGRNTLIYALSEYGLVVSAEPHKGGTWAGAEEELRRDNAVPLFVRIGDDVPKGNNELLSLGAIPWPASIDRNTFRQQLRDIAVASRHTRSTTSLSLFEVQVPQKSSSVDAPSMATLMKEQPIRSEQAGVVPSEGQTSVCRTSIYQAVLPLLLDKLANPATLEELAAALDVHQAQLSVWLRKAVDEGNVRTLSNPLRYKRNAD